DSTAPTTTVATGLTSPRNSGGTVTLSATDGAGSGVAQTYWTIDGSTPTTGSSTGASVAIPNVEGTYPIKFFSVDNVGNAEAVQTGPTILVDKSNPTISATSITSVSPPGSAIKSGTTVFYRGAAARSLQLQAPRAPRGGSGRAPPPPPAPAAPPGGWTPPAQVVPGGGPSFPPPNASAWPAGETSSPTTSLTVSDTAANSSAPSTLTFTNDS